MIGSEDFALFVVDDESGELVRSGYEGEIAGGNAKERIALGKGPEGIVALAGEPFFSEAAEEDPCACIPLKIKERVVGLISIYTLLSHKKGLSMLDHKLLELLQDMPPARLSARNSMLWPIESCGQWKAS